MKTLIIFLLASCLALSQTREPEQAQINLFGTPNYLSDDIDYFKLDEFIFGWHWGSMLKIGEATHSNMNDMSTEYGFKSIQADSFNLNSNLFLRASYQLNSGNTTYPIWTHASYDRSIMFTKSMSYSAALEILPGDSLTLNPLANDSQKHVFGFKTKDANCTNVFDSGIWRLKVEQSQVDSNTVILADPFPNNFLTYKASHTTVDTIINRDWSGRRYYLSINLRRTGENEVLDDKPVLEIEVPYLFQVNDSTFTTGTVTFDSIPSNINSDFYSLPNNRGNAWRLIYAGINGTKKLMEQ